MTKYKFTKFEGSIPEKAALIEKGEAYNKNGDKIVFSPYGLMLEDSEDKYYWSLVYTREEVRTRTVTLELPEPMRAAPKVGANYFKVYRNINGDWSFASTVWCATANDVGFFKQGLLFSAEEGAKTATEVLNKGFKL
jgi:hypothetical protein